MHSSGSRLANATLSMCVFWKKQHWANFLNANTCFYKPYERPITCIQTYTYMNVRYINHSRSVASTCFYIYLYVYLRACDYAFSRVLLCRIPNLCDTIQDALKFFLELFSNICIHTHISIYIISICRCLHSTDCWFVTAAALLTHKKVVNKQSLTRC